MYYSGQTLKHVNSNRLAALSIQDQTMWHWPLMHKNGVLLVNEDGELFEDDIKQWKPIRNELGEIIAPKTPGIVDVDLKKYLVSESELLKMRQEKFIDLENELLLKMKESSRDIDIPGKKVIHPFSSGGSCYCSAFAKFFLENRNAKPLYQSYAQWEWEWNTGETGWRKGPSVFKHTDGQIWMYDPYMLELVVIKNIVKDF